MKNKFIIITIFISFLYSSASEKEINNVDLNNPIQKKIIEELPESTVDNCTVYNPGSFLRLEYGVTFKDKSFVHCSKPSRWGIFSGQVVFDNVCAYFDNKNSYIIPAEFFDILQSKWKQQQKGRYEK